MLNVKLFRIFATKKKSMKKESIFAVIVLLALVAMGCKTQQMGVKNDPKGDRFCVKKGDTFEIHFVANASTGRAWQYINKNEVTIVDSVSQRVVNNAPEGMVGKSVDLYLTFEAKKEGCDTLIFKNSRVFDPSDEGVTVYKIVHVR
jgi:predicted secreted protein